jgi:hypothetical protein
VLSTAIGSKEHGGCIRGLSSKFTIKDGFQQDRDSYRKHDRYKEQLQEAAEEALKSKFRQYFQAAVAEEQQSGLLLINPSQEVGQQQMVTMPPSVLAQENTACAQSNVASTTTQQYPVDCISITTPCLLPYPIGRAAKIKEVAKAQVYPGGGLFEGKPIPPLYACVQVEQLLKSSYEDNKIDIPTTNGKTCHGECVGSAILWHKQDIVLLGAQPISTSDRTMPPPQQQQERVAPDHTPLTLPSVQAPPSPPPPQESSPPPPLSSPAQGARSREPSPPTPLSPPAQVARSREHTPPAPPATPATAPAKAPQLVHRVIRALGDDPEGKEIADPWHAANKKDKSKDKSKAKSKDDSNSSSSRRCCFSLPRTDMDFRHDVRVDTLLDLPDCSKSFECDKPFLPDWLSQRFQVKCRGCISGT